jgi:hypothetical protein
MSDSYVDDVVRWSVRQAELLRRLAAGEDVNDRIDWHNVIAEIERVGGEQLHAVRSLLAEALRHMLKAEAWPMARDAPTWRAEAIRLRGDAVDRFAPSMRQRIDMARLYRRALRAMPETMDGLAPLPVPEVCPVSLDKLLSENDQS